MSDRHRITVMPRLDRTPSNLSRKEKIAKAKAEFSVTQAQIEDALPPEVEVEVEHVRSRPPFTMTLSCPSGVSVEQVEGLLAPLGCLVLGEETMKAAIFELIE